MPINKKNGLSVSNCIEEILAYTRGNGHISIYFFAPKTNIYVIMHGNST